MLEMASATEDRETFYSPLPGNRAGSDDEDEVEPITPPPPPQYPRALELVRSVLREESTEDGYDRKTCDWKECRDTVCDANSGCCEDGWSSDCVDDAHELCY